MFKYNNEYPFNHLIYLGIPHLFELSLTLRNFPGEVYLASF